MHYASPDKGKPPKILLVDDDPSLLRVSRLILHMQTSFEIDTASSVDEAVEKLKKTPYDAIISDYEMPNKNGLDFLEDLKKEKNNVPFVLFSSNADREVAAKAMSLGANGFVDKYGCPEIIYNEIARIIERLVVQR